MKPIKLQVVKPPTNIKFLDNPSNSRGTSIYVQRLNEALNQDATIKIILTDYYTRQQIKKAAANLKLKLVYAMDSEFLYIKPLMIEGEMKRLMLLLREPRSIIDLEAKKLELHLSNSLLSLQKDDLAQTKDGRWRLTAKGEKQIA